MRVLMIRSIVEGSRALQANQVYELADDYARQLIRQGKCERLAGEDPARKRPGK